MFEEHWIPTQMKKELMVVACVVLAFYGCKSSGDGQGCERKKWTYFEKGKKYILVRREEKDFAKAEKNCELDGGQLLKVDGDTKAFIKDLSNGQKHWTSLYWMGLKREGKDGKWKWQDTTSPVQDFDWDTKPADDLHCGGVIWQPSTKFLASRCSGSNSFICEAKEPCSTRVALSMNGILRAALDNSTLVVQSSKEMSFDCNGVEGRYPITETIFNCTDVAGFNKTGPPGNVKGKMPIGPTFHEAVCTCTLEVEGGKPAQDSIQIDFRTSPRVVLMPTTLPTHYVFSGDTLTLKEEFYTNPPINKWSLWKEAQVVEQDAYNVSVQATNKTLIHMVTLSLPGVYQNMTGMYTLTVFNALGFEMFEFSVALKTKSSAPSSSSTFVIIIAALVSATVLALLGFVVMKAKRPREANPDLEVVAEEIEEALPEEPNEPVAEEQKDDTDGDIQDPVPEANDEQAEGSAMSIEDDAKVRTSVEV